MSRWCPICVKPFTPELGRSQPFCCSGPCFDRLMQQPASTRSLQVGIAGALQLLECGAPDVGDYLRQALRSVGDPVQPLPAALVAAAANPLVREWQQVLATLPQPEAEALASRIAADSRLAAAASSRRAEQAADVLEWQPPPRYQHNASICALLRRVRNWQYTRGLAPDGLIGPNTWKRRDDRLVGIATSLLAEMARDPRVQDGELYPFLQRALRGPRPLP